MGSWKKEEEKRVKEQDEEGAGLPYRPRGVKPTPMYFVLDSTTMRGL